MTKELKAIILADKRYENFTILDESVPFNEFAKDQDIQRVQVHSTQVIQVGGDKDPYKKYIVGFFGVFEWKNNEITSLDGDYYSENMLVHGFEWFDNEEEGITKGLDILVGEEAI